MNTIFLIIGESGSGKDYLVNILCDKYGYKKLKSYTTREPRYEGEDSHIFVYDAVFSSLDLCAYTSIHGNRYGATQEQVDEADFYIIDPDGLNYMRDHYKGTKQLVPIYIKVSKFRRFCRMVKRGSTFKQALERIKEDKYRFESVKNFTGYVVKNVHKNKALFEISKVIANYSKWW